MNKRQLAPIGGPTGYNYNLLCGLKEIDFDYQIDYLDFDFSSKTRVNNFVNNIKISWVKETLKVVKSIIHKVGLFYGKNKYSRVDLNKYDIVHFHGIYYMWECKDSLEKFNGKVVFTPHTPNRPAIEYFNSQTAFEKKHMKWFYKKLFKIDDWALNRADYIILPCEEAEEPYFKHWPYFSEYKKRNSNKFRYMLSGIEIANAKKSREEVRKEYNIPESAFVVCYVGRHNEIKGYDLLKQIAVNLLNDSNVYFLIAGGEGPIERLYHERWIEVGWTNDPYSFVTASDVFVLPNRETYFDLVMLEVLSLGSIIVASKTGGNKYFDKLKPNAVFLYDNILNAEQEIEEIRRMKYEEILKLRDLNKFLYREKFSSIAFAERYIKTLKTIEK